MPSEYVRNSRRKLPRVVFCTSIKVLEPERIISIGTSLTVEQKSSHRRCRAKRGRGAQAPISRKLLFSSRRCARSALRRRTPILGGSSKIWTSGNQSVPDATMMRSHLSGRHSSDTPALGTEKKVFLIAWFAQEIMVHRSRIDTASKLWSIHIPNTSGIAEIGMSFDIEVNTKSLCS